MEVLERFKSTRRQFIVRLTIALTGILFASCNPFKKDKPPSPEPKEKEPKSFPPITIVDSPPEFPTSTDWTNSSDISNAVTLRLVAVNTLGSNYLSPLELAARMVEELDLPNDINSILRMMTNESELNELLGRYLAHHKDMEDFEVVRSQVLAIGIVKVLENHGQQVLDAMNVIGDRVDRQIQAYLIPMSEHLTERGIRFEDMDNNRFRLILELNETSISRAIPRNQKFVNLSLQFGEVGVYVGIRNEQTSNPALSIENVRQARLTTHPETKETKLLVIPKAVFDRVKDPGKISLQYTPARFEDGKGVDYELQIYNTEKDPPEKIEFDESWLHDPDDQFVTTETFYVERYGAYDQEHAYENLQKLGKIGLDHPDKTIVAASGNEADDFSKALPKARQEKKMPDNVVIVGEWKEDPRGAYEPGPAADVFGADIYVNNDALGLSPGSSFATPVITASLASISEQQPDWTPEQLISALKQNCCEERIYPNTITGQTLTTYVYNPTLFDNYIRQLRVQN